MTAKKARRKAAKAPPEAKNGRPTKYRPEFAEQARKLALLGFTDEKMADFFEVEVRTIYRWKAEHAQFCQAVKAGKDDADATVANTLYRSALGGGTVTEVKQETDADGKVIHRKTVKELPANVTAQIFWLKNRQPQQWREKVIVEDATPPEVIAETAARFDEIMRIARERQRTILATRGLLQEGEQ
ncbi:hypothetical protein SAMN05428982_2761 [Pseudoxanthomonas sp. CF385]|uniref:hypothetical protein n=1 Tax=Pseudoxanthomonas sp. CF385 TaxID=1881042 RepID=UPI00088B403A|nr:hypothetical protein [Pseudoxanthomonas sp. CF385]SDQ98751.1 hypothetical protein SAMN05428982_2761 [Pseudoxanthomonas sp. CF385]